MSRYHLLNFMPLVIAAILVILFLRIYPQAGTMKPLERSLWTETKDQKKLSWQIPSKPKVELTLRMPLRKDKLTIFLCDLVRSAVLFWDPSYDDFVVILDEEDKRHNFSSKMNSLGLPFNFRVVYEPDFTRKEEMMEISRRHKHSYGYFRMYYSSFIMDWYTTGDTVIAWADSDVAFTIPVTDESIFRNGKIIVKGMINKYSIVIPLRRWNASTYFSLGLPMASDFMTYFPTPVYASTIRNCRNFLMKRFNSTNFEDTYVKIVDVHGGFSPVSIIFSYAYYFEKDRYDWHIDIGEETLESYNRKYLPPQYPLLESDLTPEIHLSVHTRHMGSPVPMLQEAICRTQMAFGMTNISHCEQHRDTFYKLLFVFQSQRDHLTTWCREGKPRDICGKIIDERYDVIINQYKETGRRINTSLIQVVEDFARTNNAKCYDIKYVPFS